MGREIVKSLKDIKVAEKTDLIFQAEAVLTLTEDTGSYEGEGWPNADAGNLIDGSDSSNEQDKTCHLSLQDFKRPEDDKTVYVNFSMPLMRVTRGQMLLRDNGYVDYVG